MRLDLLSDTELDALDSKGVTALSDDALDRLDQPDIQPPNLLERLNESVTEAAATAATATKPVVDVIDKTISQGIGKGIDIAKTTGIPQFMANQAGEPLKRLDKEIGEIIPKPLQPLAAAYVGKKVSDAVDFAAVSLKAPDIINRYAKDVAAGALISSVGAMGSVARIAGIENLGNIIEKSVKETAAKMAPPNPTITDAIANGIGSMGAFMIPGIGVEMGAAKMALVAPRIAQIFGLGTNTVLEAASEAGTVYSDIFDKTKDRRKSLEQATKVFGANLPFIYFTNKLGWASDEAKRVTKIIESFFSEGSQEAGQAMISNFAQHDPILKGVAEEFLVGGIVGGGVGAIIHATGRPSTPELSPVSDPLGLRAELPPPIKTTIPVVQEAVSATPPPGELPPVTLTNPNLTNPAAFSAPGEVSEPIPPSTPEETAIANADAKEATAKVDEALAAPPPAPEPLPANNLVEPTVEKIESPGTKTSWDTLYDEYNKVIKERGLPGDPARMIAEIRNVLINKPDSKLTGWLKDNPGLKEALKRAKITPAKLANDLEITPTVKEELVAPPIPSPLEVPTPQGSPESKKKKKIQDAEIALEKAKLRTAATEKASIDIAPQDVVLSGKDTLEKAAVAVNEARGIPPTALTPAPAISDQAQAEINEWTVKASKLRQMVDISTKLLKEHEKTILDLENTPGNKTEVILTKITDIQKEDIKTDDEIAAWQKEITAYEDKAASLRNIYGTTGEAASGLVRSRPTYKGGAEGSSTGDFAVDTPVELGGMQNIKPFRMPELVRLVYQLIGSTPNIKKLRKANGYFKSGVGDPMIALNASIFGNPAQAAKTLAHEVGHLSDYMDDETLKRGNIIGSLLSLRKFMADTHGSLTVTNKEIRDELLALTMYWRPYDPAGSSKGYVAYRRSSRELYADALSVLFNTPGTLERMAPKFYKSFFDHLDKKPNVKLQFFEFQAFLNQPELQIQEFRLLERQAMFRKGEEIFADKRNQKPASLKVSDVVRQLIVNKHQKVIGEVEAAASKGEALDPRSDPRYMLEEMSLADNNNHALLHEIDEKVSSIMNEHEISQNDMGNYLYLTRVAKGDRQAFGNPQGYTPEEAQKALDFAVARMGLERFNKMEEAAAIFREIVYQKSIEAVEVGAYNVKVFKEKIQPNRGTYAVFAVNDHLKNYISAGVKEQIGTHKDIANPFTATIMKTIALNRLIAKQKAANSMRDFLVPRGEMTKAEIANRGDAIPVFRKGDGKGLIEFLEDGHKVAYNVDPYIAEAFEKTSHGTFQLAINLQKSVFNGIFRPLWITYNIGFQLFRNPIRDFGRTRRDIYALMENNGYTGTVKSLLVAYYEALGPAGRRAAGIDDKLITEMIANKSLDMTFTDHIVDPSMDQFAYLNRKMGLGEIKQDGLLDKAAQYKILKPIVQVLEGIRFIGNTFETISKVAGYKVLKADSLKTLDKAISEARKDNDPNLETLIKERELLAQGKGVYSHKIAYNTRNYIGTPNWREGGTITTVTNTLFPFSNIMIQGMKADYQIATKPNTRMGFAIDMTLTNVIPKLLMLLAAKGLAGDWLKEAFAKMSEYDKSNYICVPIGFQEGADGLRKIGYFRIPHDESGRIIAATFWKMANGMIEQDPKALSSILDLGLGQLPKMAPQLDIAYVWGQYLSGKNPYDSFRGRNLLSKKVHEAGGLYGLKKMVQWTSSNMGLSSFTTSDDSTKSSAQAFLDGTPLGSVFRISNYGEQEKDMRISAEKQSQKARNSLDRGVAAQHFTKEIYILQQKKSSENISDTELQRLKKLNGYKSLYNSYTKLIARAVDKGDEATAQKYRDTLDKHLSHIIH